jgi:hypothetical protein
MFRFGSEAGENQDDLLAERLSIFNDMSHDDMLHRELMLFNIKQHKFVRLRPVLAKQISKSGRAGALTRESRVLYKCPAAYRRRSA